METYKKPKPGQTNTGPSQSRGSANLTPVSGFEWIDSDETCWRIQVSHRTLRRYCKLAGLPFSKVGGRIYFKLDDLRAFLENHKNHKSTKP